MIKLVLFAVTLGWGLIFALRLNVPPVVDEVGTVANTALLMGWDWSETAWAMGGSYFKYGFALLYWPLTLLIEDSYTLYKAMLALNMVFMALIPVFTQRGQWASAIRIPSSSGAEKTKTLSSVFSSPLSG